jgi:hypothetical protein
MENTDRNPKTSKPPPQKNELKEDPTEVQKVAGRFRTILELMNEGRKYNKFKIPQLAQIMKLHKISELEYIFTGKLEPDFSFIEEFSSTFGVNKSWLTEGKGAPYSNDLDRCSDPTDYLPLIDELTPEAIYFVREHSDTAPAFIVLTVASRWITIRRKMPSARSSLEQKLALQPDAEGCPRQRQNLQPDRNGQG